MRRSVHCARHGRGRTAVDSNLCDDIGQCRVVTVAHRHLHLQRSVDIGGLGGGHAGTCSRTRVGGRCRVVADSIVLDGERRTRRHLGGCRVVDGLVSTALVLHSSTGTRRGSTLHTTIHANHVHTDDGGLVGSGDQARCSEHGHGLGIVRYVVSHCRRCQSGGHLDRTVVADFLGGGQSCIADCHLLRRDGGVARLIRCDIDGVDVGLIGGSLSLHATAERAGDGSRSQIAILYERVEGDLVGIAHVQIGREHTCRAGHGCGSAAVDGNLRSNAGQCRCVAVAHRDIQLKRTVDILCLGSSHRSACCGGTVGGRRSIAVHRGIGNGEGRASRNVGCLRVVSQHLISTALIAHGGLCASRGSTLHATGLTDHLHTDERGLIGCGDDAGGGKHGHGLGITRHVGSGGRRCQSCRHFHRAVIAHLLRCGKTRIGHAHLLRGNRRVWVLVRGDIDGENGSVIRGTDGLRARRHDERLVCWCGIAFHVRKVYHHIA